VRSLSLLLSIVFLLAPSVCAQSQPRERTFAEFRQHIDAPPSVVEDTAMSLAARNQSLRGIAAASQSGRPLALPALVAGDVLLRFGQAPFTLYLRSTNHHTTAVLESQTLECSAETRQEARQFLRRVARRAEGDNG
jgi:hypothetical protein